MGWEGSFVADMTACQQPASLNGVPTLNELGLNRTSRPSCEGSLDPDHYMYTFELISDTFFPDHSWVAIEIIQYFSGTRI